LAPSNPDYFYQRGFVYWQTNQPRDALADFDRALRIKPNHVLALLARSDLRIETGDKAGAETDLDAANAAATKEDAVHFSLAAGYTRLSQFPRAKEQYDLWIASHPSDVKLYAALNGRCRVSALGGISRLRACRSRRLTIEREKVGTATKPPGLQPCDACADDEKKAHLFLFC